MFDDVDATLTALLTDQTAPAELRNATVSFQTPDKDFTPTAPTVNLFLFDVQENRELRGGAPTLQPTADGKTFDRFDAPLRIDCTYLVTTWSTQSADLKVKEEHHLLGRAMAWVRGFPVLPPQFHLGSGASQLYPITLAVAHQSKEETLSHFWSALGVPPRPVFTVTVTVEMPLASDPDATPDLPVQRINVIEGSPGGWALRGHVRDDSGAALPGAVLTVNETGSKTMTDADGAFAFHGLDFAEYTVRVRVAGRPPVPPQRIAYSAHAQSHDIVLN